MKIAMVTGSYPPNVCGSGDYTERLVGALTTLGQSVEVVTGPDWRLSSVPAILKRITTSGADITHLQYPTVGYGRKLGPQLIAAVRRSIVTLHEASQTHFLRRLSLLPLLVNRHTIFTNRFEQAYVSGLAPWVRRRSSVIPIGSNVRIGRTCTKRRLDEVVYFGLIRPVKGLEQVLNFACVLTQRMPRMTVRIVGLALEEHATYLQGLRQASAGLPVVWDLGLSEEAVADVLAGAAIAYVPFPDGASERRGSLLALLANGVVTITTWGVQTPAALDQAVEYVSSPVEAVSVVHMLCQDSVRRRILSEQGKQYAAGFSWLDIANQHIQLYRSVLTQRQTGPVATPVAL